MDRVYSDCTLHAKSCTWDYRNQLEIYTGITDIIDRDETVGGFFFEARIAIQDLVFLAVTFS